MALDRIDPIKFRVSGDETRARDYLGVARSQMNILLQDMSFQKLSQGVRRIQIAKDVFIECRKIFNYQECSIFVTEESLTTTHFFIIFATGSGEEAVLWDLSSDAAFSPADSTIGSIRSRLLEIRSTSDIEAVYPETNNHLWTVLHPSDQHDSPLILPDYILGFYAHAGYSYVITSPYPASFASNHLGAVQTVEWDFDYIDESPLPYPNKEVLSDTATADENDEKSSYINLFQGRAPEGESLVSEFQSLTGITWPAGYDVWRVMQFWHPFFWYTLKDQQASYFALSSEGRGILLADSWANGEWTAGGTLIKDSLTWHTAGIATINTDSDIESVIFEYVSVCHKFVDTFGTGMCDTALCDFDEHLRFYEHGKVKAVEMAEEIFNLTNIERDAQGVPELVFNSALSVAAQRHAEDQASLLSTVEGITDGHTGTDGSTPADRAEDAGYFLWIDKDLWGWTVSENVAWTDVDPIAERAIALWKNSPAHWANMIDDTLSETGIGVASIEGGGYLLVQDFGKVDHRYPGYAPFDPVNLKAYVDENFVFDPAHETTRMPKVYMVGTVELTSAQLQQLQVEE